jgi:hypothetical protein
MDPRKLLATGRARLIAGAIAVLLCIITVASVAAAASGPTRSVKAFCTTYYTQVNKIWQMGHMKTGSELGDAFQSVAAVSELPVMFNALDKVAPDTIEPDVANISASFQQVEQSANGTLSGLGGALAASIMSAGSWENFTQYTNANCPVQVYDPQLYAAQQAAARAANNAQVQQAESDLAGAYKQLQTDVTKMQGLSWNSSWTVSHMQTAYKHLQTVYAQVKAVAETHDCTQTDNMISGVLKDAYGAVDNVRENTPPDTDISSSAAVSLRGDTDNTASGVTTYAGALTTALKSAPGAHVKVTVAMATQLVTTAQGLVKQFDDTANRQMNQVGDLETKAANLYELHASDLDALACQS